MRLVLKTRGAAEVSAVQAAVQAAAARLAPNEKSSIKVENVYTRFAADLDHLFRQAAGYRDKHGNPFQSFYFADNVPAEAGPQIAEALRQSGAYEQVIEDAPSGALTRPQPTASKAIAPIPQNYLKPSPIGIDSFFAKEQPGGDGEGVAFTLIEKSFLILHPDLPTKIATLYGELRNDLFAEPDHGTASMGILCSLDDGAGTVGIVPSASPKCSAVWPGESEIAGALINAAASLNRGAVIILNTQTPNHLPSEVHELIFLCIQLAVAARRVVVENAGEGGLDLDEYPILQRGNPAFRDSGAIMVAAVHDERRSRIPLSNYGSRVDSYAWGGAVATTYPPYGYANASGASAATAIVGGTVVSLQAMYKCRFATVLDSPTLREILTRTGTHPTSRSEKIGTMPDLRAAFHAIQNQVTKAPA